jgi:TatA/E family protein of Tat protein translocase
VEILGIGPMELLVILLLLLIVFGPERLPEIGAKLGKGVRSMRRATREFSEEIQHARDALENPTSQVTSPIQELVQPVQEIAQPFQDVKASALAISQAAKAVRDPAQAIRDSVLQSVKGDQAATDSSPASPPSPPAAPAAAGETDAGGSSRRSNEEGEAEDKPAALPGASKSDLAG